MPFNTKIKIIAIAKDEGAYLTDWIFHHLYFGFDAIDIYINRTTDNSSQILDKIKSTYPQISYYFADWIDICPEQTKKFFQYTVYSQAFSNEKQLQNYTHMMFIDLDEYWTPVDLNTDIHTFLTNMPAHSCICFPWYNQLGDEETFQSIGQNKKYKPHPLVKSIIHLNSDIEKMQLHIPKFEHNKNFKGIFLPDGTPFQHCDTEYQKSTSGAINKNFKAVIIHKMFRSEIEYLSLLSKGRPSNAQELKIQRPGFKRTLPGQKRIQFLVENLKKYQEQKIEKIQKIPQLEQEITQAQKFVINRANETIKLIPLSLQKYPTETKRALEGLTSLQEIKNLFKNQSSSLLGLPNFIQTKKSNKLIHYTKLIFKKLITTIGFSN